MTHPTVTQADIGWATSAAQHLCAEADRDAAIRLLAGTFARHRTTTEASTAARIEALEAENGKLREATQWAIETLQEINPSNYDHGNVCSLNAASVEVILGLDAELRALTATEGEG